VNKEYDHAIVNTKIVTHNQIINNGSLVIDDGVIKIISENDLSDYGKQVYDAQGCYTIPGFIDIHSDAVEKEIEPRPNVFFPIDISLFELDKKLAACGISTIFHAISFAEEELGVRSNSFALNIIDTINKHADNFILNTKVHARFEISDVSAVPFLDKLIDENKIHILSFMDHTPNQGQFKSDSDYKNYFGKVYQKSEDELNTYLMKKREQRDNHGYSNIERLISLCLKKNVVLASHDDDSPEKIQWLNEHEVKISEFPINMNTVHEAKKRGVRIVIGAPNILRGKSASNNLSARDIIAEGYGDIICSDYAPSYMLHAVFTLFNKGLLPLEKAVAMVSINPAIAADIDNYTGSIQNGKSADLNIVDNSLEVPRIIKSFFSGREVSFPCKRLGIQSLTANVRN
jgi:alpha-D-ribose 1-methylphosphonate 5-triphosphate diphosphatase